MKTSQHSPTNWRLIQLLSGSLFLLLSTMQWDNARSNNQYWLAGFSYGLGVTSIVSVFFKRQRLAWDEEDK